MSNEAVVADEGYNGWSNYETWAVALWINNDQGSQEYAYELARQAYDDAEEGVEPHRSKAQLSDSLKDWHEEQMPEVEGVFADLLGAALGEVDWYEIAETFLAELPEVDA